MTSFLIFVIVKSLRVLDRLKHHSVLNELSIIKPPKHFFFGLLEQLSCSVFLLFAFFLIVRLVDQTSFKQSFWELLIAFDFDVLRLIRHIYLELRLHIIIVWH